MMKLKGKIYKAYLRLKKTTKKATNKQKEDNPVSLTQELILILAPKNPCRISGLYERGGSWGSHGDCSQHGDDRQACPFLK